MGRKVHPIGYRLGIIQPWDARWFAKNSDYGEHLNQDLSIRKMLKEYSVKAGVSRIEIERFPSKIRVIVHTAKPGILIGRKGDNVKKVRGDLETLTGQKVDLDIKEIKNPDLDAYLVAINIAGQIERRVAYRRAMKRAISQAIRQGGKGCKIQVAGRLAGAEMARTVWLREGRVPLQTLRADIDFARYEASTTYGQIGIKVWIYKGDVLPEAEEKFERTEGVYVSE
jgi:small subunit ribosomal protein S3